MRTLLATLALLNACGTQMASQPEAAPAPHHDHEWGYEGPAAPQDWGTLDPKFATCATGSFQSPIDLSPAAAADTDPIAMDYQPDIVRVVDNGHTVQINHEADSTLWVGSHAFSLVQFHMHSPSEHAEDGQVHDMELHLVHQDDEGNYAVVAVFIDEGTEVASSELWSYLPDHSDHGVHQYTDHTVDPREFLPDSLDHYQYHGSLTTPPCTETVTWAVMQTPVQLSHEHIALFRQRYSGNARPLQPRPQWALAPHLIGQPAPLFTR